MNDTKTPLTDAEVSPHNNTINGEPAVPASFARQLETRLAAKDAELKALNETHGIQLSAISTACIQNAETSAKQRIGRDNPYWTVAYCDVCVTVDREMRERERAEKAELELAEARAEGDARVRRVSENLQESFSREHEKRLDADAITGRLRSELSQAHAAIRGAVELLERTRTCHFFVVPIRVTEVLAQLRSCLPAPDCAGAVVRGEAKRIRQLESRLAEEIKWGHRNCTHDDCKSSGSDCPATPPAPGKEGGHES